MPQNPTKRRPPHHPCPACGKSYVNEGSLRKHLQSHPMPQPSAAYPANANYAGNFAGTSFLQNLGNLQHLQKQQQKWDLGPANLQNLGNLGNLQNLQNLGNLQNLQNFPGNLQNFVPGNLRMWPCSVCQAVFTHEAGLLTHMEHMRMDPKHQFAAQYVLSRAAAERRERGDTGNGGQEEEKEKEERGVSFIYIVFII